MGEILKFPGETPKLGFKRVRKASRRAEDPNQLDLFLPAPARITNFSAGLSPFEQALHSDERGDALAIELYAQAIEAKDRLADSYCNLGILESKQGHTAKAFDCFTTCLRHEPRHAEAHYNLANLYFEVNDFRLAQLHYELAAEVEPTFANTYFNLALVLALNADLSAAIASLVKYQHLAPKADARHADELLGTLRQTLAAKNDSQSG
jgi:tetratricopeptide (TPR) repeat protein